MFYINKVLRKLSFTAVYDKLENMNSLIYRPTESLQRSLSYCYNCLHV
jgi:hypothetical protein